jgi:hypothetical protein
MSDTETETNENENGESTDDERETRDDLGLDERQTRAFEEVRREAAARRRAERAAQATADELRTELEKFRVESESEQEKKTREAVSAAVAEVAERYERRLLEATIARRASGKLRDPDDAISLLPIDELLEIEDERERRKRVDEALDELLESKPYLAEANGERETTPSRAALVTQGARSERPGRTSDAKDADDWLRKRSRRT